MNRPKSIQGIYDVEIGTEVCADSERGQVKQVVRCKGKRQAWIEASNLHDKLIAKADRAQCQRNDRRNKRK